MTKRHRPWPGILPARRWPHVFALPRCAAAMCCGAVRGRPGWRRGGGWRAKAPLNLSRPCRMSPSGEHKMTAADGIAGGQNNEDVKPWPMTRAPDSVPAAWMAQTTSTIDQAIRKAIQSDIERAQLHQKGDAEAMRRTGIAETGRSDAGRDGGRRRGGVRARQGDRRDARARLGAKTSKSGRAHCARPGLAVHCPARAIAARYARFSRRGFTGFDKGAGSPEPLANLGADRRARLRQDASRRRMGARAGKLSGRARRRTGKAVAHRTRCRDTVGCT